MRKYISFILLCAIVTILSACSPDTKNIPLEQLPDDYNLEQAKADGCIIHEDGNIAYGQDLWYEFLKITKTGQEATVRLGNYYTLGDPSRYDKEYYESIKDEFPKFYVHDLTFNGKTYNIRWFEDGKEISRDYKYLMKYQKEPQSPYATYDYYIKYVLTNDNTVTWENIFNSMASSQFGAYIDHYTVYNELINYHMPATSGLQY